jgi:hypothetical protein
MHHYYDMNDYLRGFSLRLFRTKVLVPIKIAVSDSTRESTSTTRNTTRCTTSDAEARSRERFRWLLNK